MVNYSRFLHMSDVPHQPLAEEIMGFLEELEESFQEAEIFLEKSSMSLTQKGFGSDLQETIEQVRTAREYVSGLRQKLPLNLDEREDEIILALRETRARRRNQ